MIKHSLVNKTFENRPKMPKFQMTFVRALITSTVAFSFADKPLIAFIDHLFDFHPDHSIIPERKESGHTDENGNWWEDKAFYERDSYSNSGTYGQDNDRSSSEGTGGPPDRDK